MICDNVTATKNVNAIPEKINNISQKKNEKGKEKWKGKKKKENDEPVRVPHFDQEDKSWDMYFDRIVYFRIQNPFEGPPMYEGWRVHSTFAFPETIDTVLLNFVDPISETITFVRWDVWFQKIGICIEKKKLLRRLRIQD